MRKRSESGMWRFEENEGDGREEKGGGLRRSMGCGWVVGNKGGTL